MIYHYLSPVGTICIELNNDRVDSIFLSEEKVLNSNPLLDSWFDCYFNGKNPGDFPYPLSDLGSDFERRVRKELLKVKFSEYTSYGELANRIMPGMSPRAVGHALNRNQFLIVCPCHRVIGKGGKLTGFALGNSIKKTLLENEGHLFKGDILVKRKEPGSFF